jgi:hypothetical protein
VSMRVRVGPFSASTSGRVGVSAGPFGVSGGGRRGGGGGILGPLIGLMLLVGLVVFLVMWPLSLWGHAIHLTPSWHQLMNRNHHWMHEHYPLVGLRYIGALALLVVALSLLTIAVVALLDGRDARSRAPRSA